MLVGQAQETPCDHIHVSAIPGGLKCCQRVRLDICFAKMGVSAFWVPFRELVICVCVRLCEFVCVHLH